MLVEPIEAQVRHVDQARMAAQREVRGDAVAVRDEVRQRALHVGEGAGEAEHRLDVDVLAVGSTCGRGDSRRLDNEIGREDLVGDRHDILFVESFLDETGENRFRLFFCCHVRLR